LNESIKPGYKHRAGLSEEGEKGGVHDCSAHEDEVATDLAGDGGGWRMYIGGR